MSNETRPDNWAIEVTEDNRELLSIFRKIPISEANIGGFITSDLTKKETPGLFYHELDVFHGYTMLTTQEFTEFFINNKPEEVKETQNNSNIKSISGTEVEELLADQKKSVNVLETKKQLLLSAEGEDKFSDLKSKLGWDDTDKTIMDSYRQVVEIQDVQQKNIDMSILTNESIWNYCVKNNYVLAKIDQYKGAIPEELLEAIDTYRKSCTKYFDPNELFVLCRFSDVKGDNSDIKKSKRYKKGDVLPKILLLEKVTRGNTYHNEHYKVIFEMGEKTPIRNFITSVFFTHTKTANFLNNTILIGGISLLVSIIGLIILLSCDNASDGTVFYGLTFIPAVFNLTYIILFLKMVLPNWFSYKDDDISVNCYTDAHFESTSSSADNSELFNTSWLSRHRELRIFNKTALSIKTFISFIVIFAVYWILSFTLVTATKIATFKVDRIEVERTTHENGQKITDVYNQTGFFSYEVTQKYLDMSVKAQAKRLLEKKNKK